MDFKVVFMDSFLEDLEGIVKSIAMHNPAAACKLGEMIVATAETLSWFPERNPNVRQRPGVRRFVVKNFFNVFYRIRYEMRTVEVLRCWDGRRQSDPRLAGL